MSDQHLLGHLKENFDPVPWLTPIPQYEPPQTPRQWPSQPLVYSAGLPAPHTPDPNLFAVITDRPHNFPPNDLTTTMWDLLGFMALQRDPLLVTFWERLNARFSANLADRWNSLKKQPGFDELLTLIAFRIEKLLDACRLLQVRALENGWSFTDTGIEIRSSRGPFQRITWWTIPASGVDSRSSLLPLTAVPYGKLDSWDYAASLHVRKERRAEDVYMGWRLSPPASSAPFLVSRHDSHPFSRVWTNVGSVHR
jgi:hypothetical protein